MNTTKIAVITGSVAIFAVIVTAIILLSGGAGSGLYVSAASGSVTVTDSAGNTMNAEVDKPLKTGDILTVNEGALCRLVYRSKKNSDDGNYAVVEASSQVFVTGEFSGKDDSEIFLNSGSVLVSSQNKCPANIIVRTENSSYTTKNAVVLVTYTMGEQSLTSAASFGGISEISLYDNMGSLIDRSGYKLQSPAPEILGEGRTAVILSGDPPKFDSLNLEASLSSFNASTLRELFTVASLAASPLAFSSEDIRAAYDAAPDDTPAPAAAVTEPPVTEPPVTEPPMTEPSDMLPPDTEPFIDEPPVTEPPVTTTEAPRTTTAAPVTTTTAAPPQTEAPPPTEATTAEAKLIEVCIIIEEEIYIQEVEYGGNASQPSVPEIPGKRFIGWDGSFTNITEETTITAIFEDDPSTVTPTETTAPEVSETTTVSDTTLDGLYYTVTVVINGQSSVQTVPAGGMASMPAVNVPGYSFLGWDNDYTNITSDRVITAILIPDYTETTTVDPFADLFFPPY